LIQSGVAGRYAKALLLVAERRREVAPALADLKGMAEALAPDGPAARHLASPELRMQDKRQALRDACAGRVLRVVVLFLDLLLRKKRLGELPAIVVEFERLVERAQGVQRAHVVSAVPLMRAELERLTPELERITRSKVKLTTAVDPSLVGGALVRIGDRVIDRSVRSLLEAIERQLEEVSV
jgi:F-type H+-transporting ATPase subunit delta